MFNRKQKEINKLNARCVELARMLKEKSDDLRIQKHNNCVIIKENEKVRNENADIRCEIDELKDTLKLINKLMINNQYENDQVIRNKIIELSSDYQSIR